MPGEAAVMISSQTDYSIADLVALLHYINKNYYEFYIEPFCHVR